MTPLMVKIKDLKLGDVVQLFDGEFSTGIVKQLTDDSVKIFRPYGTNADFSYTGGVICYTGIEECVYLKSENKELQVLRRQVLK